MENSLAINRPDIAAQWDYEANNGLTPQDVTVGSGKIVAWKCSRNQLHRWKAPISNRTSSSGRGCPFCSGKRPFIGETDLGTVRPDIAAQWDYKANNGLTPQDVTVGSNKIVGWKCSRDNRHRWKAPISNRTSSNATGCPFCSGFYPFIGETDLETVRPDIATEWDYEANNGLTPQDVTISSGKIVGWKCNRDNRHRWKAPISNRTRSSGRGCPFCSGFYPFIGETDLGTVRPDIATEWDYEANNGLTPQDVTVSSGKIVGWKCSRDNRHRWKAPISNRTSSNATGCPFCSGFYPFIGETDLGTVRPDIATEWDYEANNGLTPQNVTVGSNKIVGWKCSRDNRHHWKASILSRTRFNGTGCPFCSGLYPFIGETDLGTVRPDIAMEWDYEANNGLTPQDVTVSSGKIVGWKCNKDDSHRWKASINSRTNFNGSGCPYCNGKPNAIRMLL